MMDNFQQILQSMSANLLLIGMKWTHLISCVYIILNVIINFRYINHEIEKHLQEHAEAQKLRDSPDLLFRPFLRWLDRNLENLFTKALKQVNPPF